MRQENASKLKFSLRKKLPIFIQSEVSECGLACVAMIASYHGHDVNLNGLRQEYPVPLFGVNLENIIDLSSHFDLSSRAIRIELDGLHHLQTPAILHWDLNHFVVLKKVSGNKVHIHDPATGHRVLRLNAVSDHFTGVALELIPTSNFVKQVVKERIRLSELWGRLVGLKRALIHLIILSAIMQIIVLATPFYLQLVVDEAILTLDRSFLFMLALSFGVLAAVHTLTKLMREWTILYYGNQVSFQMVSNVFNHLIHLPSDFYEKRHMGDILSRLSSTDPIRVALTQSVVAALLDGLLAIFTGILIFIYSPLLGAIVLVSVLLFSVVTLVFFPILRQSQEEMIVRGANEASYKLESIRAYIPIKMFSAQSRRMSNWQNLFAEYVNGNVNYGKFQIYKANLQDFISRIQTVIIIYVGARLILSDDSAFSIGMLFAFMSYRLSFTSSIISLLDKYIEFRLLGLHLERISDIVHVEKERINTGSFDFNGKIELKEIKFRYAPSSPWIIDGLSEIIEPNSFVAISGPSGTGKTTLLKLIVGLYPPTEGKVFFDDQLITDANRTIPRKGIGIVMQEDRLLTGTIADNISFFDPQVDMEKIHKVSKQAQLHETVMSMPMGYQSLIGDMGSFLSGGEKQRLLLARALYSDPKVLILDEGTANLDSKNEQLILEVIDGLDMTIIAVAHQLSVLNAADRVIYL